MKILKLIRKNGITEYRKIELKKLNKIYLWLRVLEFLNELKSLFFEGINLVSS